MQIPMFSLDFGVREHVHWIRAGIPCRTAILGGPELPRRPVSVAFSRVPMSQCPKTGAEKATQMGIEGYHLNAHTLSFKLYRSNAKTHAYTNTKTAIFTRVFT